MKLQSCYVLGLDFSMLLFLFLAMNSCLQNEPRRQPVKYLVPQGYVGWVKIDFGSQNEAALPIEKDYHLARIPQKGHLKTSSDIEYGWAKDEYYYYSNDTRHPLRVTGWGGGGMIWGGFNGKQVDGNNKVVETYLQFFVGTEDEYKKHVGPAGVKKPGPIDAATLHN